MPKAGEVAQELRRIAEALEKDSEVDVVKPWLTFYHHSEQKEKFLNLIRLAPKPLNKRLVGEQESWARFHMESPTGGVVDLDCSIDRVAICRIVEPAKPAVYDCEPVLSQLEEESLR